MSFFLCVDFFEIELIKASKADLSTWGVFVDRDDVSMIEAAGACNRFAGFSLQMIPNGNEIHLIFTK